MNSIVSALSVLPNTCLLAWGWRRWLIAWSAGIVAALALPPLDLSFSLLLAFPCLVWLFDGAFEAGEKTASQRFKTGFVLGWWFGFGYFLAGLWWIGSAFLVEADRFAWMMPFAVLAMPLGLALFHGLAGAAAALFWNGRWQRFLALVVAFSLSDWLRGHILTGFPWNVFGYGVSDYLVLAQSASIWGIYGLGVVVLLIAVSPAGLTSSGRARWLVPGSGLVLLVGLAIFGWARLATVAVPPASPLDVRIVQPDIPQAEKWKPENRRSIFAKYLEMSSRPLSGSARIDAKRLIVWPESAIPFLLTDSPEAMVAISRVLNGRSYLATGAIRADRSGDEDRYYNSVYLLDPSGVVIDSYDKVHLVPFGEYLPLRGLLHAVGLDSLVDAPGIFEAGYQQDLLKIGKVATFLPLICYEAIFPTLALGHDGRPDFLLNVTNDGWFGMTPGPYQHEAQAQMRAIEQGVPLVRAANTGISAVFDPLGRTLAKVPLGKEGVLDVALPSAISTTPYVWWGNAIFFIIEGLMMLVIAFCRYNPYSRKN